MSKWQKHPAAVWSETIVDENGDIVCSVSSSYRTKSECAKIVALVIAAPEMLELIKALGCHCEDSSDHGPQACGRCKLLARVEGK